jgi:WhiB family redox-sensing transcriptional regulator
MVGELVKEQWMDDAACAEIGTDIFFPEPGGTNRTAKAICSACSVAAQCLEFGFTEEFGIWGGLSPTERRALRRPAA